MAKSYVEHSYQIVGVTAEAVSLPKESKYVNLTRDYYFIPIAIETLGLVWEQGRFFLSNLGQHLSEIISDVRETAFLLQGLSVIVQHFNRVLFACSFVDSAIDLLICWFHDTSIIQFLLLL